MKQIPLLTDQEFATICRCMDIALRSSGLEAVHIIAALDIKLGQTVDVPEQIPDST